MFVQFGFKQPLPRMQFNEKLYKKMFLTLKKIFKHILEITYYIYYRVHYIQQIQVKGFFVSLEFEDICLQNQNSTNRHFSKITWRINIIIPKYIDNRKKQECLLDTKRD